MKNLKTFEFGRSMLETVGVLAVMGFFIVLGVRLYEDAVCSHEADRVYEDIILTVASYKTKGTARSNRGIADTQLVVAKTRTGKIFTVKKECPEDAFTVKIEDIDQKTCSYLMEKGWSVMEPICFYRARKFNDVCINNVLDSASDGYYMLVNSDCSRTDAPEKGVFAVTFAIKGSPQKVAYCKNNSYCSETQTCNVQKQVCVSPEP